MTNSPTGQRRRLGRALRHLRERCDLTGEQAAAVVERSAPWISRIESGESAPRTADLRRLLDRYQLRDLGERVELEALADGGRQQSWWYRHATAIPKAYGTYIDLEGDARELKFYDSLVVPGPFQTEAYARAIFSSNVLGQDPQITEARVAVRIARREKLMERESRITLVIEEAVLRRSSAVGAVLGAQLLELTRIAERPTVDLRVIPLGCLGVPSMVGSFTIMEFESIPPVVYTEDASGGALLEGRFVDDFEHMFGRLSAAALGRVESVELVERARADLG